MNVYDSHVMTRLLQEQLHAVVVLEEEKADVLILNTCSIREKAQEKVFSQLGRWRLLKQRNSNLLIAVAGCVASQEGERILQRAPYVDCVFGPQTVHKLPQMIHRKQTERHQAPLLDVEFAPIEKFDAIPTPAVTGPESFVTVMEGCSKFCTFCVVPYTRGEEVSRPVDAIIREVSILADHGVREVTLLGQNVNGYCFTYQQDGESHTVDFGVLLRMIAKRSAIQRIRFTTSHPIECNENLYWAFSQESKIVSHMHLPVQSGSDTILNRMKRKHTTAEYLNIVEHLRAVRPDITFSSDFIVGFPGETEADFQATLDLVRTVGFDMSYSFMYSPRPGTPAANYVDEIPLAVKQQRLSRLQATLAHSANAISVAMLDTVQQVLVNGYSKKSFGRMQGRTPNNRIVHFNSLDASLIGKIVPIVIEKILPNSFLGRLQLNTQVA